VEKCLPERVGFRRYTEFNLQEEATLVLKRHD
jgi:hypothetical protein